MTTGEASQGNERRFYSPESNYHLTPLDDYNDTVIQFRTLQQLGYPVELELAPSIDLPPNIDVSPNADERELAWSTWRFNNYPIWARPVVLEPGFEKHIGGTEAPGDAYGRGEVYRQLENHPLSLLNHITWRGHRTLAAYVWNWQDPIEKQFYPTGAPHSEGIVTEELLERCFMASIDRFIHQLTNGCPLYDFDFPDNEELKLYAYLAENGRRAITPEGLGEIVADYYKVVEELVPEIKDFKRPIVEAAE
jgi:hypothetical protein